MDYIVITNYNRLGEMGISRDAIRAIASKAVGNVPGASVFDPRAKRRKKKESEGVFSLPSGVKVALTKDGQARIRIEVCVKEGSKASEIARSIQKEVAESVAMMCDAIAYEVSVHIARIEPSQA